MKTKIISLFVWVILLGTSVFAWNLDSFVVSVEPSTIKIWQSADITIKAVDQEGNIVNTYNWDILIMVMNGDQELDSSDYTAPNNWTYSFTDQDQWTRKFTKGLIINKQWNFKVRVEDFDTSKYWEEDIKVVSANANLVAWNVKIMTPQNWETITSSILSIAGSAVDYKNSKFQVLLDWNVTTEWLVDNAWNIQIQVGNLSNGKHKIQLQILDINWKVIAKSKILDITVNIKKTLFKKISILPANNIDQGTKVTINVDTDESVSSAVLTIANYWEYPMTSVWMWKYTAQFIANTPWKFNVSLKLTSKNWEKKYTDIDKIVVIEHIWVQDVKFVRDNNAKNISLNWKFTWQVPAFKVEYWTEHNIYTFSGVVSTNKYVIKNIGLDKTYFIKIIPTDTNGNKIWDESKEIVVEPNMKKAASCTIDNIKTHVIIKWTWHYFVWSKAPWAVKYIVYKWKNPSDLSEIATLTWTEYKLPYDPNSKYKKYAYFTVKAVCDDGSMKQIDKVKKIVVWPMDWLMYALFLSVMILWLRIAYKEN